jgi:hypothetical protein
VGLVEDGRCSEQGDEGFGRVHTARVVGDEPLRADEEDGDGGGDGDVAEHGARALAETAIDEKEQREVGDAAGDDARDLGRGQVHREGARSAANEGERGPARGAPSATRAHYAQGREARQRDRAPRC